MRQSREMRIPVERRSAFDSMSISAITSGQHVTDGESAMMGHVQNLRFVVSVRVSNTERTLTKP